MRASFYDGQFGENQANLARPKTYARFEKVLDISSLPEDETVDLMFWIANTEKMEVLPFRQALRFKRSKLEPNQVLLKGN